MTRFSRISPFGASPSNKVPRTPHQRLTLQIRGKAASFVGASANVTKSAKPPAQAATATKTAIDIPVVTGAPLAAPTPPTPADLAETIDAQLTPAIRAKAAELGNHPLTIYQWVKNNIRYFPSYGSVQGAQDTLDKLAGNDIDTASLLIALYRAANIPARYVYGTIDLPAAEAMNWVGGVTKAEAAQQILGQGGVPNIALTSAGQITKLRVEHVWVESWINYTPSRGVKHTPGQGDTWVPVDASYKQYAFTQGMDLKTGVPFDANAFLSSAQQGATVNQTEGWVQNLSQANIQTQLTTYQNQVKTYVDAQKPNATVGDVLGTQTIVADTKPILPGALPYKVVTTGNRYATLPNNLRHQFQYNLYADSHSRNIDSPAFTYQQSLPNLAGKKVTLSFTPATQADADMIASYLPKPHADGSPIQASEFPTQIPAYAKVKAQLRVEGSIVAEGGIFTLGQELAGKGGFTTYDLTGWDLTNDETLVAGQATAIGLSVQGVSSAQLNVLKARAEQTRSQLQTLIVQSNPNIGSLTGDIITGDILTATVWGYFAALQSHGDLARRQAVMLDHPGMSYGLFHATVQPNKPFGLVTTSVKFPGLLMDIGHLRHLRWSKSNIQSEWVVYNRMRGQYSSALEHAIPERFFVDSATCNALDATPTSTPPFDAAKPMCAEGISAVKAIAIAQSQGQKVFTITSQNLAITLPQLSHSQATLDDMQNAVNAGKEVTISQSSITRSGWIGTGYAVVDPATGAGSYLIEGKANGGNISAAALALGSLAFIMLLVGKLALVGLIPALAVAAPFYALLLGGIALTLCELVLYWTQVAKRPRSPPQ